MPVCNLPLTNVSLSLIGNYEIFCPKSVGSQWLALFYRIASNFKTLKCI